MLSGLPAGVIRARLAKEDLPAAHMVPGPGLPAALAGRAVPLGGTLAGMAPEVYQQGGNPSASSGVFSFSLLVYLVAMARTLLSGMPARGIRARLAKEDLPPTIWFPDSAFRPRGRQLVEACLAAQEAQRPSMAGVHRAIAAWPDRGRRRVACDPGEEPMEQGRAVHEEPMEWGRAVQQIQAAR